ncbi:serine carboxypeptidase S28 [Oesophagostomum dentatum]|uniref:Serine carboxypeptidase S28 n=1 Tax=Oesophagostomum dentatum TaxID=61180 RepID=A0A0B1SSK0_OESDE|nr:serine carboxypeptidase S28 [Oesophagostomum dentatum]
MKPPSPKDPPSLTLAREIVERNIGIWLDRVWSRSEEAKKAKMAKNRTMPEERGPLTAAELEAAPKAPIELTKMDVADPPAGYETGFFLQPMDHFDNQNPKSFLQRYHKNSQWAKPGGPNFLLIGGEAPEPPKWVLNENITYLTWAKKFGAMVYSLEHRYYGDSIVGGNASNPNPDLRYLSSTQMLYDVANFIRGVKRRTNNTAPWIVFGGSYSGKKSKTLRNNMKCNLALWMRQLFPDLVLGAVGSSAPLEAKLDFYEYLEVVEKAIRSYSPSCAEMIAEGFTRMHELALTGTGRRQLSTMFSLVPEWTENTNVTDLDLQFFFSTIYGQFQGVVQYNGDNTGVCYWIIL